LPVNDRERNSPQELRPPDSPGLAEDLLDKLVNAGFDMAYSQDAFWDMLRGGV